MGWFGKLFGTDKAVESGINIAEKATTGILAGIDYAFHTDQEKSEEAVQVIKMAIASKTSREDQSSPRSVSRRVLAFMFCSTYLSVFILTIVLACLHQVETVSLIIKIVAIFELSWIVLSIIFFYFGGEAIKRIRGVLKRE